MDLHTDDSTHAVEEGGDEDDATNKKRSKSKKKSKHRCDPERGLVRSAGFRVCQGGLGWLFEKNVGKLCRCFKKSPHEIGSYKCSRSHL